MIQKRKLQGTRDNKLGFKPGRNLFWVRTKKLKNVDGLKNNYDGKKENTLSLFTLIVLEKSLTRIKNQNQLLLSIYYFFLCGWDREKYGFMEILNF